MASSNDDEPIEFPRFDEPTEPAEGETEHKRTNSGSSLLSKLSFLRTSPADVRNGDSDKAPSPTSPLRQATSPAAKKPRSRQGSLRKTALLGPGRMRMGSRSNLGLETIVSPRLEPHSASFSLGADSSQVGNDSSQLSPEPDDYPTPRASYDRSGGSSDAASKSPEQNGRTKSIGQQHNTSSEENLLLKPRATRAIPTRRDASTTDEEEALDALRVSSAVTVTSTLKKLSEDPASFFAATASKPGGILRHRASSKKMAAASSPLGGTLPMEAGASPPGDVEWDYSATEWWGWVILVLTWVVFVIGMGSCFDVWSWAWDVGETPYAPPELEDDPTLPIVGYYPALIILTGVMAWVWVIIAWVGMKYFKHAKIAGEDV